MKKPHPPKWQIVTPLCNDAMETDFTNDSNTKEEIPKGFVAGIIEALLNKTVERMITSMYEKTLDKRIIQPVEAKLYILS